MPADSSRISDGFHASRPAPASHADRHDAPQNRAKPVASPDVICMEPRACGESFLAVPSKASESNIGERAPPLKRWATTYAATAVTTSNIRPANGARLRWPKASSSSAGNSLPGTGFAGPPIAVAMLLPVRFTNAAALGISRCTVSATWWPVRSTAPETWGTISRIVSATSDLVDFCAALAMSATVLPWGRAESPTFDKAAVTSEALAAAMWSEACFNASAAASKALATSAWGFELSRACLPCWAAASAASNADSELVATAATASLPASAAFAAVLAAASANCAGLFTEMLFGDGILGKFKCLRN
mmetsp:Transcript_108033/g.344982  ORF Transcript_108033/g.344982 Transcript_108033/m.344982 type:complete len:305 (-) Transcript_108033:151-1065(-)